MDKQRPTVSYQQGLLQAILDEQCSQVFDEAGVKLYRRNLYAAAARALSTTFPTVAQLLGRTAMLQLAADFLAAAGREVFDWGEWGRKFPNWLNGHILSRQYAYLVDCARLDWYVHSAYRASDGVLDIQSFDNLASLDDFRFSLQFSPGASLLHSRYPIVSIYRAHQVSASAPDLNEAKSFLRQGRGQQALIWRQGLATRVREIGADEAWWFRLLDGSASTVAELVPEKMTGVMPFEDWLARAISDQLVIGLR